MEEYKDNRDRRECYTENNDKLLPLGSRQLLATVLFSVSKSPNKPTPLGVGKTQGLFDILNKIDSLRGKI